MTIPVKIRHVWDAFQMWYFLRKFKQIELRYDRTSPELADPRLYGSDAAEQTFVHAHNQSVIRSNMTLRQTGFTPVPRIHLVTELSKDHEMESRKKTQKLIDQCVDATFLKLDDSNPDLPQLILMPYGEVFSGWPICNLHLITFVMKRVGIALSFIGGVILALTVKGLGAWLIHFAIIIYKTIV